MLMHSKVFLVMFLPISLMIYWAFRGKEKLQLGIIVLSSLIFYSYWNWHHTPLLVAVIGINFAIYRILTSGSRYSQSSRFGYLTLGVAVSLLLLGYFKYFDWVRILFHKSHDSNSHGFEFVNVVLPIGISFYVFEQISCLVDTYRQSMVPQLVAEENRKPYGLLEFSSFVSFFPHLIAGPIVRAKDLIPQFRTRLSSDRALYYFILGVVFFFVGFVKKTYIADNLAVYSDFVFADAAKGGVSLFYGWIGTLSYTFQLYFDFSGYADMAIGVSLMYGFKLPVNFNSPFRAVSPIDFWRRWHMSLSTWLRDYVFNPISIYLVRLGFRYDFGERLQFIVGSLVPIFITFVLSGIWHGSASVFLFWGICHAVLVMVNTIWQQTKMKIPWFFSMPTTFLAMSLGFILFRSPSMEVAKRMYRGVLSFDQSNIADALEKLHSVKEMISKYTLERHLSVVPFDGPEVSRAVVFIGLAAIIAFLFPNLNKLLHTDRFSRYFRTRAILYPATAAICIALPIALIAIATYMELIAEYFPEVSFVYFAF